MPRERINQPHLCAVKHLSVLRNWFDAFERVIKVHIAVGYNSLEDGFINNECCVDLVFVTHHCATFQVNVCVIKHVLIGWLPGEIRANQLCIQFLKANSMN